MFSNWPRCEEEKGKKTDTEGRERSGMAGLVCLGACVHEQAVVCAAALICNAPHRPTVYCLTTASECMKRPPHPQMLTPLTLVSRLRICIQVCALSTQTENRE